MECKSSLSEIDAVTKQLKVSIPAKIFGEEMSKAIDHLAKSSNIKGFRAGKAPRQMVEKMHGDRVRFEVANQLISTSLSDLVKEHKIEMVGAPDIDISSFDAGKDLEYTASISVFPLPDVSGYKSFKIEVPSRAVTDEDVDKAIESLRDAKATFEKLAFRQTAQAGDVIDAMLSADVEGEKPSRPEPLVIVLGQGKLPKELDTGLVGLEIGQSREIEAVVDDQHPNQELRGKKVQYKVTLNGLSEKKLPEVTDDFAKSLDLKVGSVLELRLNIRKQLEDQLERDRKAEVQTTILDKLVEANQFPVPQIIIDDEIRTLLVRHGLLDPNKADINRIPVEQFREQLGQPALKRVRSAIIIDRIAEAEKIVAESADINKRLDEIAAEHGLPRTEVEKFFQSKERAGSFALELTRSKVLDFLHARAVITETVASKTAVKETKPAEAKA